MSQWRWHIASVAFLAAGGLGYARLLTRSGDDAGAAALRERAAALEARASAAQAALGREADRRRAPLARLDACDEAASREGCERNRLIECARREPHRASDCLRDPDVVACEGRPGVREIRSAAAAQARFETLAAVARALEAPAVIKQLDAERKDQWDVGGAWESAASACSGAPQEPAAMPDP